MRKTLLCGFFILSLMLAFGLKDAFAECMLDAEFVDANGDDNPDIKFTSRGKIASGQLKVINNDETACKVKVSVRVYEGGDVKIAVKSISFGVIKAGEEATKTFIIASQRGSLYGRTLVAVLNPTIIQEDGESVEIDDGNINTVLDVPETSPDLSAEWVGELTLSKNMKKATGQLKITNLAQDLNDDAQKAGRFAVVFYRDDPEMDLIRLKKVYVNGLNAGESKTISFNYSSGKSLEGQAFVAKIDPDNEIYETDEQNNEASSDVTGGSSSCGKGSSGISLSANILDFGSVKIGEVKSKKMVITNCGNTPVNISDMSISDAGNDVFGSNYNGDIQLMPQKRWYVSITFKPSLSGTSSEAVLTITHDSASTTVTLSGLGK